MSKEFWEFGCHTSLSSPNCKNMKERRQQWRDKLRLREKQDKGENEIFRKGKTDGQSIQNTGKGISNEVRTNY